MAPSPGQTELDETGPGETRTILAGDPRSAPRLRPTPAMHAAGRDLLGRAGIGDDPFIAIAPGAAFLGAKCWPAERYGELCRRLAGELGRPCVLLGRRDERALGAAVRAVAGDASTVDLTGHADVGMLLGILARASLFVGNDSGPAHVAAALGLPGVAIFGSTSDGRTGPVGHGMRSSGGSSRARRASSRRVRWGTSIACEGSRSTWSRRRSTKRSGARLA